MAVGSEVGYLVGVGVGYVVGSDVGAAVGYFVGAGVGTGLGAGVGAAVGSFVGAGVGVFVGAFVGNRVLHMPSLQRPNTQSVPALHFLPGAQLLPQTPPQSMSVSSALSMPSLHAAMVGELVAACVQPGAAACAGEHRK